MFLFRYVTRVCPDKFDKADLRGSSTPLWCDICITKKEQNEAVKFCIKCSKKHCQSHSEVCSVMFTSVLSC